MGRRPIALLCAALVLAALTGCGASRVRQPLISGNIADVPVMGMTGVRDWGDAFSPMLQDSLVRSTQQYLDWVHANNMPAPADVHVLAISGGGADGAFGAGVLSGWTANGTRPEFRVVTGVSTGALSAPFVFLGPKYDDTLRRLYTTVDTKKIFFLKGIFKIFRGDSIADTGPLMQLVQKNVTAEVMAEIAREHERGRRLFIATTNLDAQRNVVWDIGAIAASGNPNALTLIHKVLVASAAIPVAFPPVYIPVQKDGKTYDEMHVDGGVISQFIVYDAYLKPKQTAESGVKGYDTVRKHVYVIVNNKIGPVGEPVKPRLLDIANRSISTLIKSQARGSLAYSYLLTKRDGMTLGFTAIPDDFDIKTKEPFDPAAMLKTFELGYQYGLGGPKWTTMPPGYTE